MFAKRQKMSLTQDGVTLVELAISLTVLAMISVAFFSLFTTLIKSSLLTKRRAVALTLATNQMEYLKSLPYNNLAIVGGSIIATNPIPGTTTSTLNGAKYTIKTSINYVDDAFDGCGSYPTQALKQLYCRNYPAPSGAPATDTNPADYKIIHVSVTDTSTLKLAEVDTQISARVAETASTTGALFVSVIDNNGNPVSGANVQVSNTTLAPTVSVSDSTDGNGTAIFYGLPPDTNGYDYFITASATGYSTLTTIVPSGSLQPNYSSQQIFTQQSSFVTLPLRQQGTYSLLMETTDTGGAALQNVKVYVKGGYKKYTATTDTTYYYDNVTPTDIRPTTNSSGLAALTNLVPGTYVFCGDIGATSCTVGGTTYYLAAAIPYSGINPFNPITVPTYSATSPATSFLYNGNNYLQKVRLMLTTDSTFPRITNIAPYEASQASGTLNNFSFQVNGTNLPCTSTAATCNTTVKFLQGSSTYTASCTGSSAGLQLSCTVNLTGSMVGGTQMVVTVGASTLTLPAAPMLGGIVVTP